MTSARRLIPSLAAVALLAACAPSGPAAEPAAPASPSPAPSLTEVSAMHPRAVLAHDGGLLTIDLSTGETVSEVDLPGFLRLNDAGDGRHVLVTEGDRFRVFDAGLMAEGHDDHFHYFAGEPTLTDVAYEAAKPGHVVTHDGLTVMFGDGDGSIQVVPSASIADDSAAVRRFSAGTPHHGVAVQLGDGTLVTTQGTEESRSVVEARRGDTVTARTEDCPGVHGEAVGQGEVVVAGCTNGPVLLRDGAFHKVKAPDAYARTGNLVGTEASPIVLGDYKVDEHADHEHPTRVALIDTRTAELSLIDLGASYWFRSLARGPHGEGLVLTTDGALQVIDVEKGAVTAKIPAIDAWEEPAEWQQPGPVLKVVGERAYVAAGKELVVIDLASHEVVARHALQVTPTEMAVVTGLPTEEHHDH